MFISYIGGLRVLKFNFVARKGHALAENLSLFDCITICYVCIFHLTIHHNRELSIKIVFHRIYPKTIRSTCVSYSFRLEKYKNNIIDVEFYGFVL